MTRRGPWPAALAFGALLLWSPKLQAQLAGKVSLGGGLATTRLTITTPGTSGVMTGATLFGEGRIGTGRFWLSGAYRQGTLKPDSGGGASQDLVDGLLLAEFRALPWLTIGAGPRARALVVTGSTEQWTFVEGRVRAEGDVIQSRVRAHVQLWTALSAHSNAPGTSAAGRGGEAGLTLRLPRAPVWVRLVYAIDRASAGPRAETLEDVALSVGYGLPW